MSPEYETSDTFPTVESTSENLLRIQTPEESFIPLERKTADYVDRPDLNDTLLLRKRSYNNKQYASIYYSRLHELRKPVLKAAKSRWEYLDGKKPKYISKVLDIKEGELCYVIGTIYVEMEYKPNILDDVTKEHWVIAPPPREKYAGGNDSIVLEDESGRISLNGNILKSEQLVTGIVVGVLGIERSSGELDIVDICFPNMLPQEPKAIPTSPESKYVALISGLDIGDSKTSPLSLEMLQEYLTGELGGVEEQSFSSKIVRVIFAGNVLSKIHSTENEKKPKRFGHEQTTYDDKPINDLDDFLHDICQSVDVDIMPGENDPANTSLPQQPMLPSLFPKSQHLSSFNNVTNPYWFKLDGTSFLATSGQTLDDIMKYTLQDDRLGMAVKTLLWRHVAPTAPDTLWCYPFQESDPFVMQECPHVYFIGNQPEFSNQLVEGPDGQQTRVILVPKFSETSTIVLVNLSTHECHPISFNAEL
ncbi:DNA polymerase delta small subunit Cdc1 [Basidiobolus ranarum]|uniref:DNA polymerase delta small subunit Cdc1 n=1 Tax=Basidiobolus ranarum TaxID=34480 RepID=A0ABR2W1E9_9FUNG